MICGGKLRVLDLFSGIGGFSLGLERATYPGGDPDGFETVAFCEIEEFPRKVLAKHWPDVPCYRDVRELTAERLAADGIAVDVITGGFPCQDLSASGKQVGFQGERSSLYGDCPPCPRIDAPKLAGNWQAAWRQGPQHGLPRDRARPRTDGDQPGLCADGF